VERIGLAVLGCGRIARRHAEAASALRGEIALSFASRDREKAESYRRSFGGVAAFGSYEAAVGDPSVHAVLICTPHHRHLDDALMAAARGKHILVEKPIARSLEETDRIIEAAKAEGVTLMVAENFHFMPAFRLVSRYLANGWVGELRQIQISARGLRLGRDWRFSREMVGGGALIDGGIHYVHLLRQWGGRVNTLYALSPPKTLDLLEGEDTVSLLAGMDGGVVGFLSNSWGTPGMPRFQWSVLSGTEGSIFADHRGRVTFVRSHRGRRLRFFWRDLRGHQAMLREFADAVRRGRPPEMDGSEGRRDLAVVLAAYRSIAERQPVTVEP
jgi:predicted dehydrogenase